VSAIFEPRLFKLAYNHFSPSSSHPETMASTTTVPFILASAFSTNAFDGNPAAIAFVDLENTEPSVLQKLSGNFNQPMAAFISAPVSPEPGIVTTEVRYFTPSGTEVPLCGHATIAATAAILSLPEFKEASLPARQIRFKTLAKGQWVSVDVLDGGWLEIQLPTAEATSLPKEDVAEHAAMFRAAFKKDLKIVDIKTGGEKYPYSKPSVAPITMTGKLSVPTS
jgi:PhzF family phenazine biosynthesis protein